MSEWDLSLLIGVVSTIVSVVYCFLMYHRGDEVILQSINARPVQHGDNPELFNIVEEMSIAAGVPMPRVYLIDDPAPNAMATGQDPEHATVAVTTGLQKALSRDELQGVIAHEICHIRNYDTRVMLLAATLVGSVAGVCSFFLQVIRSLTGGREDEKTPRWLGLLALIGIILTVIWLGPVAVAILLAVTVAMLLLAPLSAHLLQLAVSRQREYLADASAVELTRFPQALADALWKIERDRHRLRAVSGATAHLFIANPLRRFQRLAHTAFASHPPLKERIRRLAMMAQG
jgi:heat shock protein HtpX